MRIHFKPIACKLHEALNSLAQQWITIAPKKCYLHIQDTRRLQIIVTFQFVSNK